jgi:hypothetical protein
MTSGRTFLQAQRPLPAILSGEYLRFVWHSRKCHRHLEQGQNPSHRSQEENARLGDAIR